MRQLRAFLAVSAQGTVTEAANALGMAPSSVSQSIRTLEASLDAELFVRTPTGMTLTLAGRRLADRAPALLAEWDAVRRDVTGHPAPLTMAGTEHIVATQLPAIMRHLGVRRPEVEVQLETLPGRDDVVAAVRSGAAAAGLLLDSKVRGDWVVPTHDPELEFADLTSVEHVLGVAPDHPLAGAGRVTLADLRGHRIVVGPRLCAAHVGIAKVQPDLHLEHMASLVIARGWAANSLAAMLVPAFAVISDFAAGVLTRVEVDLGDLEGWLRLVWRPDTVAGSSDDARARRDLLYAASAALIPAPPTLTAAPRSA